MGCLCEQIAGGEHILPPVCIGHLWLFEHLARPELEALATAANRKTLSPREAVFHQGDPADNIVLIKSGRVKLIKNLSRRIALLTDHVGSLTFSSLEQKLFGVLANVAKEHGEKNDDGYAIPFPLTHEDLGFLVGAHRVSVTRAMKALKQSGKIAHRGQNLVLPSDVAFATDSF